MVSMQFTPRPARGAQAIITDRNFFDYRDKSKDGPWVLMFYAPWCQHCQALEPYYAQAAGEIKGLSFGKIDATVNVGVSKRYDVTGYPTLKWMRDGHVRPYTGDRSPAGFRQLGELLNSDPIITSSPAPN
jgi:thiol-disulfide isomerase/thioredoxin